MVIALMATSCFCHLLGNVGSLGNNVVSEPVFFFVCVECCDCCCSVLAGQELNQLLRIRSAVYMPPLSGVSPHPAYCSSDLG